MMYLKTWFVGCVDLRAFRIVAFAMATFLFAGTGAASQLELYRVISAPPARLTLAVYSLFAESQLAQSSKKPEIDRFFSEWESLVGRENGLRSSAAIRFELFGRYKFARIWLSQGLSETAKYTLANVDRLEDEPNLLVRLKTLAETSAMMTRDPNLIPVAAAVSNLITEVSMDSATPPGERAAMGSIAARLSNAVAKAAKDADGIDILAPENLIGGGLVFRLVKPLLLRSAFGQFLKTRWAQIAISEKTAAQAAGLAASIGGHAVALNAGLSAARAQNAKPAQNANALSDQIVSTVNPAHQLTVDGVHRLAERILFSRSLADTAMLYADLIAQGERLVNQPDAKGERVSVKNMHRYIQRRDQIVTHFDRYMKSRSLTVADDDAIRVLRGYVEKVIGSHEDHQWSVLQSLLSTDQTANCVVRALDFSAYFYPAYKKYENLQMKFGLMLWMNHVETVIWDTKYNLVKALHTGKIIDEPDTSNFSEHPEEIPAILDPRVVAAAYLYREKELPFFGVDAKHLQAQGLHPRHYLVLRPARLSFKKRLRQTVNSVREMLSDSPSDPNPSPFMAADYADPIKIEDDQRQKLNKADSSAWAPSERPNPNGPAVTSNYSGDRMVPRGATTLSRYEWGEIQTSLKPSEFPVILTSQDIIAVIKGNGSGMRPLMAINYEDFILSAVQRMRANPLWGRLVRHEVKTLSEFSQDIDFANGVADLVLFYEMVTGDNDFETANLLGYLRFRRGIGETLRAEGLGADIKAIEALMTKLLSPYAIDTSGRRLKQYFESSNGLPMVERLKIIRGFKLAFTLLSQVRDEMLIEVLVKRIQQLKLQIVDLQPKAKEKKKPEVKKEPSVHFGNSGKPVFVYLKPIEEIPETSLELEPMSAVPYLAEFDLDLRIDELAKIFKALGHRENFATAERSSRDYLESIPQSEISEGRAYEHSLRGKALVGDICMAYEAVKNGDNRLACKKARDLLVPGLILDDEPMPRSFR